MNPSVTFRLCVMMFLQFFVWGAWFTSIGTYMGGHGMTEQIGRAFSLSWGAAIVSPFFLGMIADRFFPTQRVLGVMHLLGAPLIFLAPSLAEGEHASAPLFLTLISLHMLCYMPTIGLTNTLAFRNITHPEKQFPMIRVFGTLGWIAAGLLVSWGFHADATAGSMRIAGVAGVLMGLFSFFLPHTPPPLAGKKASARDVLGLDALAMLRDRSFLVFIVSAFLICAPLSAYYAYTGEFLKALGDKNPTGTQTYGQMSEVFFMLAMPWFFARLGVKWMLFVGMLAWVLRYGLFAGAAIDQTAWMVITGIVLHGICYDFFFVTGYIYTDKKAPEAIRGQAQGFVVLVTLGFGMLIGSYVMGEIFNQTFADKTREPLESWEQFWTIPTIAAGVIMVLFALVFKDDSKPNVSGGEGAKAAAAEEQP